MRNPNGPSREELEMWMDMQLDEEVAAAALEKQRTKARWRIESRWPSWARWRIVTPRPHGERWPFDAKGLVFDNRADADNACTAMRGCNDGEFRVVTQPQDPLSQALNEGDGTYKP